MIGAGVVLLAITSAPAAPAAPSPTDVGPGGGVARVERRAVDPGPVFLEPFEAFAGSASTTARSAADMTPEGTVAIARVTPQGAVEVQLRLGGRAPAGVTVLQPARAGVSPSDVRVLASHAQFTDSVGQGRVVVLWGDGAGATSYSFARDDGSWTTPRSVGADEIYADAEVIGEDGLLRIAQRDDSGDQVRTHLRILGPDGERTSTYLPSVRGSVDDEVALDLDAGDDVAYLSVIRSRAGPSVPDGSPCSTGSELALLRLSPSGRLRAEGTRVPRTQSGTQVDGACAADAGERLGDLRLTTGYFAALTTFSSSSIAAPEQSRLLSFSRNFQSAWTTRAATVSDVGAPGPLGYVAGDLTQAGESVVGGVPTLSIAAYNEFSEEWEDPEVLTGPSGGTDLRLSGAFEAGAFTWREALAPHRLQYRAREFGEDLLPIVDGPVGAVPTGVGSDAEGNGVVAFDDAAGDASTQVVPLDTSGPVLRLDGTSTRLSEDGASFLPRTTGRNRFALDAYDVWSEPVDPPRWSFGQGSQRTGFAVHVTYRKEDAYSLNVRAADSLGHETHGFLFVTVTDNKPPKLLSARLRRTSAGRYDLVYRAANFSFVTATTKGGKRPIKAYPGLFEYPRDRKRNVLPLTTKPLPPGRYRVKVDIEDSEDLHARTTLRLRVPRR